MEIERSKENIGALQKLVTNDILDVIDKYEKSVEELQDEVKEMKDVIEEKDASLKEKDKRIRELELQLKLAQGKL